MTGHTDGRNTTLRYNNEMIRDYCAKNDKILFDFADIESWSPDGKYDSLADDDCTWCASWCEKNPSDCAVLPEKCAHSPDKGGNIKNRYNCVLKGKAFWWMMARLAGWVPEKETKQRKVKTERKKSTAMPMPTSQSSNELWKMLISGSRENTHKDAYRLTLPAMTADVNWFHYCYETLRCLDAQIIRLALRSAPDLANYCNFLNIAVQKVNTYHLN